VNEHVQTLIFCGLAFALGMGFGQFWTARRHGKKVRLELEARDIWTDVVTQVAWIIVIVVFIASVLQSVLFTYDQRKCNVEMVETIKYRAELSLYDSKLNDARAEALKKLVDSVIASTAITSEYERGQFVRSTFEEYQRVINELNAAKVENEKKRAERPYPEC
jgi:hypothetical protein